MAQKEEYACPEVRSKAVDGIKLEGRKQDDRGAQRGIRQRSEKGEDEDDRCGEVPERALRTVGMVSFSALPYWAGLRTGRNLKALALSVLRWKNIVG